MSANESLIPTTQPGFDTYIRTSIPYLLTLEGANERWKRLGMTQAEMDQAEAYRDEWWTGVPATPGIYELHSNSATKTSVTKSGVQNIMNNFTPFFSNLLKRMSTLAFTDTDKQTLHIPQRDTTPTARGPITKTPIVGTESTGTGKIGFRVRLQQDSSNPSMHPDADAIVVKYQIGGTEPANANACTKEFRSTKAKFEKDFGLDASGQMFYGFAQYVNDVNPANNGPQSNLIRQRIL